MRYALAIVGLIVVIGGIVALKAGQIGQLIAFGEAAQAAGPPPEYVATDHARLQPLQPELTAVGTVTSARGVEVSNEVPGVVAEIFFESGQDVNEGDVLVRLDTSVERAQLAEARSRRRLANTSVGRTRNLASRGAESAAALDADVSQLETSNAQVRALQARLRRKTIRAPFSGRLGIRNVNLGQYLDPGTRITVLETLETLFVDFTLPQQELDRVTLGMQVEVRLPEADLPPVQAVLDAIDPSLDASTRSLRLRARVQQGGEHLRPGMFVRVSVPIGEAKPAVMVPATAIAHAAYGDSVFVVEPKPEDEPGMRETDDGQTVQIARQQFIRAGQQLGDFVEIVDGVEDGQQVVVAGAFKLRNGAPIVVDNSVKPDPSLDPEVENQ